MKRTTKTNTPRDVDDYLSRVSATQRKALEQLRRTIKSVAPTAEEIISYQIPTFKLNGRMLVSYAAFAEHCSFFPGAGPTEVHQEELKSFATSKGTVRFTPDKPLSSSLIKKMVKTRIKLNEAAERKKKGSSSR